MKKVCWIGFCIWDSQRQQGPPQEAVNQPVALGSRIFCYLQSWLITWQRCQVDFINYKALHSILNRIEFAISHENELLSKFAPPLKPRFKWFFIIFHIKKLILNSRRFFLKWLEFFVAIKASLWSSGIAQTKMCFIFRKFFAFSNTLLLENVNTDWQQQSTVFYNSHITDNGKKAQQLILHSLCSQTDLFSTPWMTIKTNQNVVWNFAKSLVDSDEN